MYPQELYESTDQNNDWYELWLNSNARFLPLILNSHFDIQTHRLPEAVCIMASENEHGRLISIELYRYKWNYLFNVKYQFIKTGWLEKLRAQVRGCDGHIYFSDTFIVIDLPLGYYLDIRFGDILQFTLRQIEYVDLETASCNNPVD